MLHRTPDELARDVQLYAALMLFRLMSFERSTRVRFYTFPDLSNLGCLPGIAGGLPSCLVHGDDG
jgi:hypothetical protein